MHIYYLTRALHVWARATRNGKKYMDIEEWERNPVENDGR